jgi:hypothetical protein
VTAAESIRVGRFEFRVVYREVGGDEGVTVHLFGPHQGASEEVLRFDCFREQPHYHLGWSYRDEPFTRIESADPFEWTLEQLASDLNGLLAQAAAEPMSRDELDELKTAVAEIRRRGVELVGDPTSGGAR